MLAALAAAGTTGAVLGGRERLPAALRRRLTRRNHAGVEVTLLEGPAVVTGATVGLLVAGAPAGDTLLVLVPGLLGAADDLVGDTTTKGVRGHLGALRAGRVTTGAAKVLGVGGVALLAAAREHPPRAGRPVTGSRADTVVDRVADRVVDTVVGTVLVAGAANLVNLLDLRPGRALKVVGLLAALGARSGHPAATAAGCAAGALPADLAGRAMLGDCGANPLGALVGLGLMRTLPPRGRLAAALGLTALTLLSERVSFTEVIAATPWLRRLDELGRPRPGGTPA